MPILNRARVVAIDWSGYRKSDTAANDSDKSFTVGTQEHYHLVGVRVKLVTTATVGNRLMAVEIKDAAGRVILGPIYAGAVQAASLTRYYEFGVGLPLETAFRGPSSDMLLAPLPGQLFLDTAWSVRVYDAAAVDAAADDMELDLVVQYREAPAAG